MKAPMNVPQEKSSRVLLDDAVQRVADVVFGDFCQLESTKVCVEQGAAQFDHGTFGVLTRPLFPDPELLTREHALGHDDVGGDDYRSERGVRHLCHWRKDAQHVGVHRHRAGLSCNVLRAVRRVHSQNIQSGLNVPRGAGISECEERDEEQSYETKDDSIVHLKCV